MHRCGADGVPRPWSRLDLAHRNGQLAAHPDRHDLEPTTQALTGRAVSELVLDLSGSVVIPSGFRMPMPVVSPHLVDPWNPAKWTPHFGNRPRLADELRVLERAFPLEWREHNFSSFPLKHQLAYDLMTFGGWTRLLVLASELLRHMNGDPEAPIPSQGRLRVTFLYPPAVSEFIVAPLLDGLGGKVKWQPQGNNHGCDYRVDLASGFFLGEVKRLWRSHREEEEETRRVVQGWKEGRNEPHKTFTEEEERAFDRLDADRLYPHVEKAARQLKTSAMAIAGTAWRTMPGILFLDVHSNWRVTNLLARIDRWGVQPWAKDNWAESIDLVVLFDFVSRDNGWGISAQAYLPSRANNSLGKVAASFLQQGLGTCDNGHFHVPHCPPGTCRQERFDF